MSVLVRRYAANTKRKMAAEAGTWHGGGGGGQSGLLAPKKSFDDSELSIVTNIKKNDILIGRGKRTSTHPGNVALSALVATKRREYLESEKADKTRIIDGILIAVSNCDPPGRFIKESDGVWKCVGVKSARAKVQSALAKWEDVTAERPGPHVEDAVETMGDHYRRHMDIPTSGSTKERVRLFLKAYKEITLEIICLALAAYGWANARHEKMIGGDFILRDVVIDTVALFMIVAAAYIGIKHCAPSNAIEFHFIVAAGLGTVLGMFFSMGGMAGIISVLVG